MRRSPAPPTGAATQSPPSADGGRRLRNGILYPLDLAYKRAGIEPPAVRALAPEKLPLPYRSLLVHGNDMTITLERHFGGRVVLRPLSTFVLGGSYFRRVLLAQEYSGRPVEMGALRIRLDAFPAKVRAEIRRHTVPLGRILRDAGIDFVSQARVFLEVTPNQEMMGVFWMREPRKLYGRRTEVLYRGDRVGDIVEVLPLV
jgi:chorismate-pyruvate lyase